MARTRDRNAFDTMQSSCYEGYPNQVIKPTTLQLVDQQHLCASRGVGGQIKIWGTNATRIEAWMPLLQEAHQEVCQAHWSLLGPLKSKGPLKPIIRGMFIEVYLWRTKVNHPRYVPWSMHMTHWSQSSKLDEKIFGTSLAHWSLMRKYLILKKIRKKVQSVSWLPILQGRRNNSIPFS